MLFRKYSLAPSIGQVLRWARPVSRTSGPCFQTAVYSVQFTQDTVQGHESQSEAFSCLLRLPENQRNSWTASPHPRWASDGFLSTQSPLLPGACGASTGKVILVAGSFPSLRYQLKSVPQRGHPLPPVISFQNTLFTSSTALSTTAIILSICLLPMYSQRPSLSSSLLYL